MAPLSLVEPLLQPDQEVMRQQDQRHVVVPARPEAQLVVIQAHLPFAFGQAGFDGPAHAADPHQPGGDGNRAQQLQPRPEGHTAGSLTTSSGTARGFPITRSSAAIAALRERKARITAGSN